MRSGRFCLQWEQGWMSQWFSLRLFHQDQSGEDWWWQLLVSSETHGDRWGPDGNLCPSLKGGSSGDSESSPEWGVQHIQKVTVLRREQWERAMSQHQEACAGPHSSRGWILVVTSAVKDSDEPSGGPLLLLCLQISGDRVWFDGVRWVSKAVTHISGTVSGGLRFGVLLHSGVNRDSSYALYISKS
jgi:hypothetical protein